MSAKDAGIINDLITAAKDVIAASGSVHASLLSNQQDAISKLRQAVEAYEKELIYESP